VEGGDAVAAAAGGHLDGGLVDEHAGRFVSRRG
jgi:hypothetical protein